MQAIQQQLKIAFRDNFGPSMLLLVVGTIAFVFIGYLLFDLVRTLITNSRARRQHRKEIREQILD